MHAPPAHSGPPTQAHDNAVPLKPGPEELAVFDAHVLGALFNHDRTLIASVLQTFVSATSASLPELASATTAQDWVAVAALAHKITGACRLSGFPALGQVAHAIETVAKQGDLAAVQQELTALEAHWNRAQAAVAAWNS